MKLKPAELYINTYNTTVTMFAGWNERDFLKYTFKNWMITLPPRDGEGSGYSTIIESSRGPRVVICMPKYEKQSWWAGLLVHECTHAAMQMLAFRGQKAICTEDHEYFTYLVQEIFQNMLHQVIGGNK